MRIHISHCATDSEILHVLRERHLHEREVQDGDVDKAGRIKFRPFTCLRWWDERWRLKFSDGGGIDNEVPSSPTSCLPLPPVSAARPLLFVRS